ncbi:MAG TPA: hypothetical protein VGA92_06545 [Candidatus Nitrosotenuis sp.]
MKKALEITLGVIADLVDAIAIIKAEMRVSSSAETEDMQKIVFLLDKAADFVIDAVVIFGKHETRR